MYSLTRTFTTEAELFSFIELMEKHSRQEKKKLNQEDKRGGHMKSFHEKAKQHQEQHPNLTYRECMASIKNE